jgi:hypothetical protein
MTAHPGWTRAGDWWDIASQRLIAAGVIALAVALVVIVAALAVIGALHKVGRW